MFAEETVNNSRLQPSQRLSTFCLFHPRVWSNRGLITDCPASVLQAHLHQPNFSFRRMSAGIYIHGHALWSGNRGVNLDKNHWFYSSFRRD